MRVRRRLLRLSAHALRPEVEGAVPSGSTTAANPPFVPPGTAALASGADACVLVALLRALTARATNGRRIGRRPLGVPCRDMTVARIRLKSFLAA